LVTTRVLPSRKTDIPNHTDKTATLRQGVKTLFPYAVEILKECFIAFHRIHRFFRFPIGLMAPVGRRGDNKVYAFGLEKRKIAGFMQVKTMVRRNFLYGDFDI